MSTSAPVNKSWIEGWFKGFDEYIDSVRPTEKTVLEKEVEETFSNFKKGLDSDIESKLTRKYDDLKPGFKAEVLLREKGNLLFQKEFSSREEFESFIGEFEKEHKAQNEEQQQSFLKRLIMPLRTQDLRSFAGDLFCPNLLTSIVNADHIALRLFSLIVDIATCPIRLVASPFRIHYNNRNPKTENPVKKLLQKEGKVPEFKGNIVKLCYKVSDIAIRDLSENKNQPENKTPSTSNEKSEEVKYQRANETIQVGSMEVAVGKRGLLGGTKCESHTKVTSIPYTGDGKEWVLECYSEGESSIKSESLGFS